MKVFMNCKLYVISLFFVCASLQASENSCFRRLLGGSSTQLFQPLMQTAEVQSQREIEMRKLPPKNIKITDNELSECDLSSPTQSSDSTDEKNYNTCKKLCYCPWYSLYAIFACCFSTGAE